MSTNKRISFDYDSTLNTNACLVYSKELIKRGYEIIILTSRMDDESANKAYLNYEDYNSDLKETAIELGIKEIHFTCHADKSDVLDSLNVVFHIDDDLIENSLIRSNCKTPVIDFFANPEWKEQCEHILTTT